MRRPRRWLGLKWDQLIPCQVLPPGVLAVAAPPKLRAMIATNGTAQPSERAAIEVVHSTTWTSLQGASALKNGIGHTDLTGAHVESCCAALPSVRPAWPQATSPLLNGTAPSAALPTSNTTLEGAADMRSGMSLSGSGSVATRLQHSATPRSQQIRRRPYLIPSHPHTITSLPSRLSLYLSPIPVPVPVPIPVPGVECMSPTVCSVFSQEVHTARGVVCCYTGSIPRGTHLPHTRDASHRGHHVP